MQAHALFICFIKTRDSWCTTHLPVNNCRLGDKTLGMAAWLLAGYAMLKLKKLSKYIIFYTNDKVWMKYFIVSWKKPRIFKNPVRNKSSVLAKILRSFLSICSFKIQFFLFLFLHVSFSSQYANRGISLLGIAPLYQIFYYVMAINKFSLLIIQLIIHG